MAVWKTIGDLLSKYLLNNITAKLMAMAMAIALWLYAFSFSYIPSHAIWVPVKIQTPEGWSVAHSASLGVDVLISYPRRFEGQVEQALRSGLVRLETSIKAAELNPEDEQIKTITLKESNLIAPRAFAIKVNGFSPSDIAVQLIRETAESVRVIPRVSDPPPGYEVAYKYPIPASVMVRGRKDIIATLARTGVETEEINISTPPPVNATEWQISPPARIPTFVTIDGGRHPIQAEEQVQCRILLTQIASERVFTGIPIRILTPPNYPFDATIRERTTDVRIHGPSAIVGAVKPENIILYVDVSDLKPQELQYTQRVEAYVAHVPGANELTVRPATPDCAVKVSAPVAK